MKMPSLQLPKTIRFPEENEIPKDPSVLKRLEQAKTANIVQGYILKTNQSDSQNQNVGFKFYAEINIDNQSLWSLVVALSDTLPDIVSLLFGHADSDVHYGHYEDKSAIFEFIDQYKKELTQDAFISFGLIYHDENELIELFVDESKYIKYWGGNEALFRKIMDEFELDEIENIEFIDEYPKIRESLVLFDENVVGTKELINILQEKYLTLS